MPRVGQETPISAGDAFGRWTVVAVLPRQQGHEMAQVRCACGTVADRSVRTLANGTSQGCQRCRFAGRHKSDTPEYDAWNSLVQRCTNPNNPRWKDYGGRGIAVCPRWRQSFAAFLGDVGARPGNGHSIDRIDNDGNYEPGNVRWATRSQQQRNRRSSPAAAEGARA